MGAAMVFPFPLKKTLSTRIEACGRVEMSLQRPQQAEIYYPSTGAGADEEQHHFISLIAFGHRSNQSLMKARVRA